MKTQSTRGLTYTGRQAIVLSLDNAPSITITAPDRWTTVAEQQAWIEGFRAAVKMARELSAEQR